MKYKPGYVQARHLIFVALTGVLVAVHIISPSLVLAFAGSFFESESGARVDVSLVSDANASGGSAIEFTDNSTVTCPNADHTPGGSDGQGGCWPYEGNTGVPAGTTLTNYTGPCTILSPTVIDSKTINCDLSVRANLTITKSVVNGYIDNDPVYPAVVIEDSNVVGPNWSPPAVGYSNLTIRRTEITGGQHNILCSDNCIIEDNWLHSQYNAPGGSYHNNAFISNGGSNISLRHNVFYCSPPDNGTGGGCTADASIFGDFAVMTNVTFDHNLFMATPSGGYCGTFGYNPSKPYGSNPSNITVINNVFQRGPNNKCGVVAPVTGFLSANGNVWTNNTWADGGQVPPAN